MPRKRRYGKRGKKKGCKVSACVKKYVKKELRQFPEKKYTNVDENGLSMCRDVSGATGATAAYYCITDQIVQGTGDTNQRIGDSINLIDMDARFLFYQPTSTNPNPFCRLIVFQWHNYLDTTAAIGQALAAILPISNILNNGGGGVSDVTSPYDIDHQRSDTFTILYDKMFGLSFNNPTTSNTSINQHHIHIKKKLRGKVLYVNGSQTSAQNHIFVLAMSNNIYDRTNNPQLVGGHQIRFTDA